MKLKFIGLLIGITTIFHMNGMQDNKNAKFQYSLGIKQTDIDTTIEILLLQKNPRSSMINKNENKSETVYKITIPTSDLINNEKLTEIFKLYSYLYYCKDERSSNEINRFLEIACDYERKLIESSNPFAKQYSNELWNNYFKLCNAEQLNCDKLLQHLKWKSKHSIKLLLSNLHANQSTINQYYEEEIVPCFDLYPKFLVFMRKNNIRFNIGNFKISYIKIINMNLEIAMQFDKMFGITEIEKSEQSFVKKITDFSNSLAEFKNNLEQNGQAIKKSFSVFNINNKRGSTNNNN